MPQTPKQDAKKRRKKIWLTLLAAVAGCVVLFGVLLADELHKQTAFFTAFHSCMKQAPQDKDYQPYLDPANIPCYQASLRSSHDQNFQPMLASLLVKQGRYAEARPIYVGMMHPSFLYQLIARNRLAEARRMLRPGGMEAERAKMLRADQAQRDLVAVSLRNNQIEADFLKQHAVVENGMIISMSAENKAVWLKMRQQHSDQQMVLVKLRSW